MALVLQGLDQQSLGPLDSDPGERAVTAQPLLQICQAGGIMGISALVHDLAQRIDQAQLMIAIAPVDPGEQPVGPSRADK